MLPPLSAILLTSTLAVSAFLIITGLSRFLTGRASGFTAWGTPHMPFPVSALVGAGEIALGAAMVLLPSPGSMLASYLAMTIALLYAWRAARAYRPRDRRRPGDATGWGLTAVVAACGVSVVAIVDSLALQPPLARLFDGSTLLWVAFFVAVALVTRVAVRRAHQSRSASGAAAPRPRTHATSTV